MGSPPFIREFSPAELRRIEAEATRRIQNHPETWSVDPQRKRNESMGVAAEWAVCEWLELSEDPVFDNMGPGGDGGVDLVIPDGRKVEVKSTIYGGGRLVPPTYQGFRVDLMVLCVRERAGVIRGVAYATWADWEKHSYMHDLGAGVGLQPVMDQRDMRPLCRLVEEVRGG